jgi:hypothetical protein
MIQVGDASSVGANPTSVHEFAPVNQYALQVERFSTLAEQGPARHWPIEDSLMTLRIIDGLFRSARERQSVGFCS